MTVFAVAATAAACRANPGLDGCVDGLDSAHIVALGICAAASLGALLIAFAFRERGRPPASGGDRSRSTGPAADNSAVRR